MADTVIIPTDKVEPKVEVKSVAIYKYAAFVKFVHIPTTDIVNIEVKDDKGISSKITVTKQDLKMLVNILN